MTRKNNYVMRRLDTPKDVTLPNSRTFYAKYQRIPRSQLSPNVITKSRKSSPKEKSSTKRQKKKTNKKRGRDFFSSCKKKSKNSTLKTNRKNCSKKAIDCALQLYKLGTSKIKNETARIRRCYKLINNFVTKYGNK